VFPRASSFALFFSLIAAGLKMLDQSGFMPVKSLQSALSSSLFGSFTFILGFMLVFRSSHCYTRFWTGAQSLGTLRAQLHESISGIAAFTRLSKNCPEEIDCFIHTVVRLASLLHANILQAISTMESNDIPVVDQTGIDPESLQMLATLNPGSRVDIVSQWISNLIVDGISSGVMCVPPPILSRTFQELEKCSVEVEQLQQLLSVPFPFPYAQASWILLSMFSVYTPLVMVWNNDSVAVSFLSTFICLIGMYSVEMIADQLDNPFGSDANDLPLIEYQMAMNKSLLLLLSPMARQSPKLTTVAKRSYSDLVAQQSKVCRKTVFDLTLSESESSQYNEVAQEHHLLSGLDSQRSPNNRIAQQHCSLSCVEWKSQHDHSIVQDHCPLSLPDSESSQDMCVPHERCLDDGVDPAMVRQPEVKSASAASTANQPSTEIDVHEVSLSFDCRFQTKEKLPVAEQEASVQHRHMPPLLDSNEASKSGANQGVPLAGIFTDYELLQGS